MKGILAILMTSAVLSGCAMFSPDDILLQGTEVSLTCKGELQASYEADKCQLAFNESRNEYRMYHDKLTYWFIIRCSERPVTVGQEVSAYISWNGKKDSKTYNDLRFKVKKTDKYGRIWLWNDNRRIGIIIQDMQ